MRELVSIIIPVFNALPYLEECLASAINQSYRQLEIIVIDDGSTDGGIRVVKKYADADSRIQVHSQNNHGLGYTRNRGIALSKGKYLFFLDADDIIPPHAIRSLVAAAERKNADYAVGQVLRFNERRMYVPVRHLEFNMYRKAEMTTLSERPELLQDSIACNKLWKRSLLVDHNLSFTEGKYYEDLALTMKAAVLSKKIQIVDEVVYHWRVREDEDNPSITQQQMKLDNTRHRLEVLAENRRWLLGSQNGKGIIEAHDLKSLLDVLRLHVTKFALIKQEEKQKWLELISAFLKSIPEATANKLPDKEKMMYTLLREGKINDLYRFSEMLMNTEKIPTVYQEQNRFVLKGKYEEYDVTSYFKPIMVVENIEEQGKLWRLEGQLSIPKASHLPEGKFYVRDRAAKQEILLAPLQLKQTAPSDIYPCEELHFIAVLDIVQLFNLDQETIYDFYFQLAAYPLSDSARIRVLPAALKVKKEVKKSNITLSLYRTQYGNLSLSLLKKGLKHSIKERAVTFFKKRE